MKFTEVLSVMLACLALLACGGDKGTDSDGNRPPGSPANSSPSDGAVDQHTIITLYWHCVDPDGDPLWFDVYFGTGTNPPKVSSGQTDTTYNPQYRLQGGTTYYWKVLAKDDDGKQTAGPLWSFSTAANRAPLTPSNPSPPDQAIGQELFTACTWTCSDPDGDPMTYDVYFGTNPSPPLAVSGQTELRYDPGELAYGTVYYWKVVAEDDQQHVTEGPLWHFTSIHDIVLVGRYEWQAGGDVVVSGNYAYRVIDVSNPNSPVLSGDYFNSGASFDIELAGDYAYVSSADSLMIVNVSNPNNPVRVGAYPTPGISWNFAVSGDYVYLAVQGFTVDTNGSVQIVDISNPSSPQFVSKYELPGRCNDVAVLGSYAYAATGNGGFHVIDVSDPADPSRTTYRQNHYGAVFASGASLLAAYGDSYALDVLDISNPAYPVRVFSYLPTKYIVFGMYAAGDYAYLVERDFGLEVVDISTPNQPVTVGRYPMSWGAQGVFADDQYIYVAHGTEGLHILQLQPVTK